MNNRDNSFINALGDLNFLKFLIFDLFAAIIFGFIVWVITKDNISSFLISLVISNILLIVDLRFRLTGTKEDIIKVIGFQREALEDHFLFNSVQQFIEGYSKILLNKDTFFLIRVREVITECLTNIANLQEGYMEIRPEEVYSFALSLVKEINHTFFATSFVKATDFWFRGAGKEYLNENLVAAKRGVSITRIFIIEDLTDLTQQVRELINQLETGEIIVKIAHVENLSSDLLHDMAIFDERYVEYLDLIPGSKEMRGARFYRDETEIHKAKAIRDRILRESRDASEVLSMAN